MKKTIILLLLVITAMTTRAQISWKDAPVSVSVGATYNSLDGDGFGDFGAWAGIALDINYKYIYTGYAFAPKQNVYSGVFDANSFQFNLGASLPFQVTPKNVLTISPYLSLSSVTAFRVNNKDNWDGYFGLGPGVKASFSITEKINVGLQVTKIFITTDEKGSPDGWTSIGATIGYNL